MAQRFSQTPEIADPSTGDDVARVWSVLRELLLAAKDPQSGRKRTDTHVISTTMSLVNIPDAATTVADSLNFISLAAADAETIVKCLERFSFLQNSRAEIARQLVESRQALSRCRLEKAAVEKRLEDVEDSLRRTQIGNTFQGSAAETERTLRRVSLTDAQSQQQQHIPRRRTAHDPLRLSTPLTPAGCTPTRPGTVNPSDELRATASLSIPLPVTIGALPSTGLEMDTVYEVVTSSAAAISFQPSGQCVAEVSMPQTDPFGYVESFSTKPNPALPTGSGRTISGLTSSTESSTASPQSSVVSLTPFLISRNVSNRKSKPDETSASAAASGSGCDVAVSRDLVDKLTQQNQRLKRTLRQLVSNKYGSVDKYLTMQEYEDVIGQLRDDNRLLSTLNETLRDLIRTRNEGDVDALAQKCLQLRDKISVLEKSISVKETLLNALCKQKQQQQQQQPRDLSGTQQQRLQSDDERVNQLLVDFVKLKQKYAESTDKYRQQIELLQRQVSRQAASTSQQREPVHFSVAEVGEDVPAKTQSADIDVVSVDIIRPPPSSQPPPVNVTSPASYGVGASGGTQLPRQPNDAVLTCPRCEREFAAHEDQLFMTHCVRCIDD